MLISFTVANWRSFREAQRFDLMASRERSNPETLTELPSVYGTRKVLPMAAVYGANASGKTNLIDALSVMRRLVVHGTGVDRPIPVDPNRLDAGGRAKPTSLEVEILVGEHVYQYGLEATRKEVKEEYLYLKRSRSMDKVFQRHGEDWEFGGGYDTDRNRFIAEGTRSNQLFLHNSVSQNANEFRPVFDWFAKTLDIVGIEAQYGPFYMMLLREDFRAFIDERLRKYGTGASHLLLQSVARESIPVPEDLLDDCLDSIANDEARYAQLQINVGEGRTEIYVVSTEDGFPTFQKVQLGHLDCEGREVAFDLSQESMGTQRLLKLLPLFFELASGDNTEGKVYVVDELDRSFHTALTSSLVKMYLDGCGASMRNQLIFTTHDLLLMRHKGIRKDEQWIAENNGSEGTRLICIGSHRGVRSDTTLLNAYEHGVFGGYPAFD